MISQLLCVAATGLPVGYFMGFLSYPNELRAEKEAIRRRTEKFKRSEKIQSLLNTQVSGKKEYSSNS